MISTRSAALVIDTVVCLTLAKWETVSGRFGGYLKQRLHPRRDPKASTAISRAGLSPIAIEGCVAAEREPHRHRRSGPCPTLRSAVACAGHENCGRSGDSRGNRVLCHPAVLRAPTLRRIGTSADMSSLETFRR